MIRDFTKEDLEAEESVRDTELTLGGGTLFVLGGGLIGICVLCFGLGYAVGHRTSTGPSASNILPTPNVRPSVTPVGSGSKPGAGQAQAPPPVQPAAEVSTDTSGDPTQPAQVVPAVADNGADSAQPQLKQAAGSQVQPAPGGPLSTSPSSPTQILPPMTKTQGWMVQIAAVSHSEDADVLVNALRRRGYSVTARRDNGDSLIHVQTGPFVNRNDANAMRQKLLNDGYNAVVQ
ncbi:SPOR domain-containing protein [Telmatobacter sp. DSM 110680]|uniref:SPOR domain-containing protein n=1 Tax=Telmatobacter sp. DSM 110680 TaxID=3036704 RepID=A0AAU7DIA0_9BACT